VDGGQTQIACFHNMRDQSILLGVVQPQTFLGRLSCNLLCCGRGLQGICTPPVRSPATRPLRMREPVAPHNPSSSLYHLFGAATSRFCRSCGGERVSWSFGICRALHNDVQSTESASSQLRALKSPAKITEPGVLSASAISLAIRSYKALSAYGEFCGGTYVMQRMA
jgi:hypothetical protein